MKHLLLAVLLLLPAVGAAQNWDLVWKLTDLPFQPPQEPSEMAIVKAGFDTDEDGWGEFLCAWTDTDTNAICMYEATGDNTYELVWHYILPPAGEANTFAGIAVGDMDNNGTVDILVSMPMVVGAGPGTDPNPLRIWAFEWNGVQGENAYGVPGTNPGEYLPTSGWNFNVADNSDIRPYSLTIEDIDNDGVNELIVGVRQSNPSAQREVLVISVLGEFTGFHSWIYEFEYRQTFGGSNYSVTTGDLDGDGNREIYALIWDMFTMRIWECTGDMQYTEVFAVDELYAGEGIDYGALDGVRVADVNGDGMNEMYIATTEDPNKLFIVTGVTDVSLMDSTSIKEFYTIPPVVNGGFRAMYIDDPDEDGLANLMIAGEADGRILSLEYKGTGDPADSASWDLQVLFDVWEESGLAPGTFTPRFFYGSPAGDMDGDEKDEYVFVNYSTDHSIWADDAYVWVIEIDVALDVTEQPAGVPAEFALAQNYPNPFNPVTTIRYSLPERMHATLKVYTTLGEEVATLVDGVQEAGTRTVQFDASGLSSGVYLYRLAAEGVVETRSMVLIK